MKTFSGNPIDLIVQQMVNTDAASQRAGIASMTNSISSCQCWAQSYFLTTIISKWKLKLTRKKDIAKSLKASKISKNKFAMKEIKSMIENSLNPFLYI